MILVWKDRRAAMNSQHKRDVEKEKERESENGTERHKSFNQEGSF